MTLLDEPLADAGEVELVDDETDRVATAAVRAAYAAAIELVAPRVLARINGLTAAGDSENDQIITDAEWAAIAEEHVDDAIGDGVLDGVVAGASQFLKLASPQNVIKAFTAAASSFAGFASELRSKIDTWIGNKIGQGITGDWGIGKVIEELGLDSPLSKDKADLVAATETQAAVNAGTFEALQAASPAAIRWVTMRDEKVRPAHAAADKDTIPFGTLFVIGGHEARFPGDPNLPPALRFNCRCHLAYVEGTEARRVVGATKAELRAKAAALSISGRSTMNKGQLQTAVLKDLCLQGLAGGPDCPDVLDQMNRTTLLAHARGEGIVGRYRMTRDELVYQLRQTMRGGNTALVAKGYSTTTELAAAKKRAVFKQGRAEPGEFASSTVPSPAARRQSRQALFDEFGGGKAGSVPCVHCGLRLGADPAAGFAVLVPEPIIPWSQGGSLALKNLVPACPGCFRARGGRGFVAAGTSAGATKAWESRGRNAMLWLDGGTIEEAFTMKGDKYDARVGNFENVGGEYGDAYEVTIYLYDKQGKAIGVANRQITDDGDEVHHDVLSINESHQGQGIGAEYLRDSVKMYQEYGVKRVTTEATSDEHYGNGAYTWAVLGFTPTESSRRHIAEDYRKAAGQNQSPALDDEQLTERIRYADKLARGDISMKEFAKDPIAKKLLLGDYGDITWDGYIDVAKGLAAAGPLLNNGRGYPPQPVDTDSIDYDEWAAAEQARADAAAGLTAAGTSAGASKAWESRKRAKPDASSTSDQAVESFAGDFEAREAFNKAIRNLDADKTQAYYDAETDRRVKFAKDTYGDDRKSYLEDYQGNSYDKINKALKADDLSDLNIEDSVKALDGLITDYGTSSAAGLLRGKGPASRLRELDWKPGHEFTDDTYGSWTSDAHTATKFTKMSPQGRIEEQGPKGAVLRMVNSPSVKSIPGKANEGESIIARGQSYRVVGSRDFKGPGSHYRIIDVEAVDGLTAAGTSEGAVKAWATRDRGDQPVTAEEFARRIPEKRTTAPAEWFASPEELRETRALIASKVAANPKPTRAEIAKNRRMLKRAETHGRHGGELRGNSTTRRLRGEALFAEFGGDKKGYCPCGYCGIKVSPRGRGGYASMQQDKILTAREGGKYGTPTNFPNLIPACTGCNASRNDEPYHLAMAAAAGMAEGTEMTAFPLGWNDPELDTLDTPVQGILERRMVTLYGHSYEQWLVGGEVIDPTTLYFALTAAGTSEGARKAWETRGGSSGAGDVADQIRADHPGVTLELVDKVHGDPHWELDRLIVPNKGEGVGTQIMGELTDAADAAGMPIALTPEPIGSGSRTALERFYKRHGFVKNTGSNKLDSSKEAMVRYPKGMTAAGTSDGARKAWESRQRKKQEAAGSATAKADEHTIGTVHSDGITTEFLGRVVDTTIRRRIAKDIANDFGVAQSAVWKNERGYKLDKTEKMIVGIVANDPKASKAMVGQLVKQDDGRYTKSDDAEFIASVEEAAAHLDDNPTIQRMADRYGPAQIVTVESADGASARYASNYIVVAEIAGGGVEAPPEIGGLTVDSSLSGTLRHEYGHHVHSMLSTELEDAWLDAHTAWGKGSLGVDAMEAVAMDSGDGAGMSVYARTNWKEAFAETFALVSHPDFDYSAVPDESRPLVDTMLRITK